jgi:hypothetical protein
MMGRHAVDQSQLFDLLNLEEYIPAGPLLRRLNPWRTSTENVVAMRGGPSRQTHDCSAAGFRLVANAAELWSSMAARTRRDTVVSRVFQQCQPENGLGLRLYDFVLSDSFPSKVPNIATFRNWLLAEPAEDARRLKVLDGAP